MLNNSKNSEFINPALINDEELLINLLEKMGFTSKPVPSESNIVICRESKFIGQPQRFLFSVDNVGFESHAAVSVEDNSALYIYYYQIENDLFDVWETFSGEVEIEAIRKSIRSAVTRKDVAIRFHYFWPERIHTAESLDVTLEDIGFKSHEAPWPNGLPSMGESGNAPHRLLLGNEHNLDTDAIVSLEDQTVNVYYRDLHSNNFKEWANLVAKKNFSDQLPYVKCSVLYSAIMTAMTNNKETDKFLA